MERAKPSRTEIAYRNARLRDQLIDEWRLRWHTKLIAVGLPRRHRRVAYLGLEILCLEAEKIDVPHPEVYRVTREVVAELDADSDAPHPDELLRRIRTRIFTADPADEG